MKMEMPEPLAWRFLPLALRRARTGCVAGEETGAFARSDRACPDCGAAMYQCVLRVPVTLGERGWRASQVLTCPGCRLWCAPVWDKEKTGICFLPVVDPNAYMRLFCRFAWLAKK